MLLHVAILPALPLAGSTQAEWCFEEISGTALFFLGGKWKKHFGPHKTINGNSCFFIPVRQKFGPFVPFDFPYKSEFMIWKVVKYVQTGRQKKISRYVAVSFGNLAHISQKSSGWRFKFSHCCSLYNHPNPCHCRCMCCIGNCFWHPQERELINHILTVSSVFTFWRNICRQKILSCHLYSHNSQCT